MDAEKGFAEALARGIEERKFGKTLKLEEKWQELKARGEPVAEAMEESAKDVGSALELVGGELKAGYERIKKLLQ